jgi:hypothetical protein
MANCPRFDLFSGFRDHDAIWKESIEGLENAREKMEKCAAENPGHYFVFSTDTSSVVAEIDTQTPSGTQTQSEFRQLLERAIAEPDRDTFLRILDEMSASLGVVRGEPSEPKRWFVQRNAS